MGVFNPIRVKEEIEFLESDRQFLVFNHQLYGFRFGGEGGDLRQESLDCFAKILNLPLRGSDFPSFIATSGTLHPPSSTFDL